MKRNAHPVSPRTVGSLLLTVLGIGAGFADSGASGPKSLPAEHLSAVAAQQYSGEGISVTATPDGARLRCAFQRLEGEVTKHGLRLRSTAGSSHGEGIRVLARSIGRESAWDSGVLTGFPSDSMALPIEGQVRLGAATAQFVRPGLIEEYSVSVDGVRQDFIVEQRPEGEGELCVELSLVGASAESLVGVVRLTLNDCGRRLIYNRLRVLDALGRELAARFEVTSPSELAVAVDDAAAVYPVRIDPTFSDADWISMGGIPGANGEILAAAADGLGNIYIGGNFTAAGEVHANRVAKWDGSSWSALGDGLRGGVVRAMAVSGAELYVGGSFLVGTNAGLVSVAKWNGNSWTNVGKVFGSQSIVYALAASGATLYAGGDFTSVGGIAATNIARWDGSGWSAVGQGSRYAVFTMVASETSLYAGGSACWIARWDGAAWSALGSGLGGDYVTCLAVSGDDLYAGGAIYSAGGAPVSYIAKWNGASWSAVGSGLSDDPTALAVYGGDLYAAGVFTGVSTVARWNGSTWSNLPTTGNFVASELLVANGSLHAAGGGGGGSVGRVVRLDGNAWVALSQGVTSNILALAVMGNDLYAGGRFKTAGGHLVNHVAKWDGSTWSPLGSGVNTTVYALTVSGTNLYAGGAFTNAGGTPANRIAKWDGTAWSALGTGLNNDVLALATLGTNVHAGGNFTSAGGVSASRVARWNGSAWSALGVGVNSTVNALTVSENILYAGGYFTSAGAQSASRIAKWDGNAWSAVGGGFDSIVNSLAASGTDLYAGGAFSFATNGFAAVQVNRIAKWDGTAWSPLGAGMYSTVNALAISGTDLFAAGSHYSGVPGSSHIAKWDGAAWYSLGSGLNNTAFALAATPTNLYVGGQFTRAGDKASYYAAKAYIGPARGRFTNMAYSPDIGFSFLFVDATAGHPYRIQASLSLVEEDWTDVTIFTYTAPVAINYPVSGATNRFFRAITP